ncbi:piRNA biogenesis protein EXD1-like [Acanthaster planci]|uniref:PiRNA biogenesis protein EXD1-like n=1 Tax=Acanthaster planci TaxID=133434 RepID=A0A8B7YFV6_ACAPL|nr:piRNA biogenesis protein EXD1-like [Acanthaster planci]
MACYSSGTASVISGTSLGSMGKIGHRELVDQVGQIQPALAKIREPDQAFPFLAVNCEGEDLSRRGTLSLVCVATKNYTYLFDIKTLGTQVFDEGLRDLLQDPDREKLMFDCRQDSDCLWHQHGVKLANVLDLQLLQIIYREDSSTKRDIKRLVRGYQRCLEIYLRSSEERLIKLKLSCKPMMEHSGRVWLERPIQAKLQELAALSVRGYLSLYQFMNGCLRSGRNNYAAWLRCASQKYVEFLRDREVRLYDKYERNAYLPWRLIPERASTSWEYKEEVACMGCKRCFPLSDFTLIQLKSREPKCPVCRKVSCENF